MSTRKSTKADARESAEFFSATFEQAAMGVAQMAPDGRWLRVNRKLCDILGYSQDELLKLKFQDITHPDDLETDRAYIQQMFSGEIDTCSIEKRYIRKDRATIWADVTVSLVRKLSGEPTYFISFIEDIMPRKQAENALRESERRLKEAQEMAHFGSWHWDVKTGDVEWSEEVYKIFRLDPKSFTPRIDSILALSPWPEDHQRDKELIKRAIEHHSPGFYEQKFLRPDKSIGYYHSTFQGNYDENDDLVSIVGTVMDITERKQSEKVLQEREAYLTAIIENQPGLMWLKNQESRFLAVNHAFAVACRRQSPKDVEGKTDLDIWPRELAEKYRADDASVIRANRSIIVEEIVYDKGEATWFETFKTPVRDGSGNIVGTTGYAHDITTRKQAEAALAESQRYLRIVLESTADGMLAVDQRGRILWANSRFFEIWRIPQELRHAEEDRQLLEYALGDLAEPDAYIKRIQELYASEETSHDSFRFKDGRLIERYSCPLLSDGKNIGRLWSFRDMTERDKLEDQLRQAQKVEAIGRLAGGVAHDFNNLTAIVLGYGEMVLGQLSPEDPARKSVVQILEAGRRSAVLTRQLLAFSRKQTLQPEVLDLNALLRNLEKMLGRIIGEDIQLEFKLAADLGRVTADPGQVEQIVTNLVVNARDAMPRGGRLTIETADVELDKIYSLEHTSVVPGRYVLLALTDTGCGMDKATMARLFEPFFTTKEKGKGTGLGLATVYGIVKQSGGYVWAYSEPGKGTAFKIYLPQTDATPELKVVEVVGEPPRGSGERILLVEDEASLRQLCATLLTDLGYRVSAAANGTETLLLVREKGLEPDLVITDVIMPGMSGAKLSDHLRRDRPDLGVLYMSGYPDDAIARHGVLDSGTPFIQKPFTERSLAAKVRETLGGKAAPARACRRMLMIDDDEQYRELVQHFCKKRGHVFAGVDSSAAALAALTGQPFDVLLVDMNIPGTSGEQVLREIRASGCDTPAIVLTGDVASADMDLLRPLGVVQALEKSSSPNPLLQAIEKAGAVEDNPKG